MADPDRYLSALFAPPALRSEIAALFLLNAEIAKVAARVNEPMAGLIRFQWWRDGLMRAASGGPSDHEVLRELMSPLVAGRIAIDDLLDLIDQREAELDQEGFADPVRVMAYSQATGGALHRIAAGLLGVDEQRKLQSALDFGTAYTIAGIIRAMPEASAPEISGLIKSLGDRALAMLQPCRFESDHAAAFLVAIPARRDLRRAIKGRQPRRSALMPLRMLIASRLGRV